MLQPCLTSLQKRVASHKISLVVDEICVNSNAPLPVVLSSRSHPRFNSDGPPLWVKADAGVCVVFVRGCLFPLIFEHAAQTLSLEPSSQGLLILPESWPIFSGACAFLRPPTPKELVRAWMRVSCSENVRPELFWAFKQVLWGFCRILVELWQMFPERM